MSHHQNSFITGETSVHITPDLILAASFLVLLIIYMSMVSISNQKYKKWPIYRTICWTIGTLLAILAVYGPLADLAAIDFVAHMLIHLLLSMLAPLLMAIAAPITLILRTVNTQFARKLTKLLRSKLSWFYTHPVVTALLNIGGMALLYLTDLFAYMHETALIHIIIHLHLFLAGYLFTISIIYIDPIFHRKSYLYRAIILIFSLAGHGIISKYLYAHAPKGVSVEQAELGSMLMYYGGDIIDAVLIFIFCLQWYRATRPKVGRLGVEGLQK